MIKDGGPAFPRPISRGDSDDWRTRPEQDGMTLRDYFATKANEGDITPYLDEWLQSKSQPEMFSDRANGKVSQEYLDWKTGFRSWARYRHADAMLAERERRK